MHAMARVITSLKTNSSWMDTFLSYKQADAELEGSTPLTFWRFHDLFQTSHPKLW